MKTIHSYPLNKTGKIKNLCPGDTFKFTDNSNVYMKTDESDGTYNSLCLNLGTGIIARCTPTDTVIIVECLLTVYDKREDK